MLLCVRIANLFIRLPLEEALRKAGANYETKRLSGLEKPAPAAAAMPIGEQDAKDVVLRSVPCSVKGSIRSRVYTDLVVFRDRVEYEIKQFGMSRHVSLPIAALRDARMSGVLSLELTDSDGTTYAFAFESAEPLREALNTIDALRSAVATRNTRVPQATAASSSSTLHYKELEPRDTSLLLNELDWSRLFANAETVDFKAGATILGEGEQYRRIWQITDGEIDVFIGKQCVATMPSGDMFGELTFLMGGGASASLVASRGGCSVTFVERSALQVTFDATPLLAGKFYKFLALVLLKRLREREQALLRN